MRNFTFAGVLVMGLLLSGCAMTASRTPAAKQMTQQEVLTLSARADKGNPDAQARLGRLYEQGQDPVRKDLRKAVDLFQKATAQGSADAQNRLAGFYRDGRGPLSRNERTALDLYLRAANQGHAWAQYNAGIMLEEGKGVGRADPKAAYFWLRAASRAPKPVPNAEKAANRVSKHLSPFDIQALDARLAVWKPTRENPRR